MYISNLEIYTSNLKIWGCRTVEYSLIWVRGELGSPVSTPIPALLSPIFTKVSYISDNTESTLKNITSLCSTTCQKWIFFGTENRSQCWCGEKQLEYSATSKSSEIDFVVPCVENKDETCGGFWWMTICIYMSDRDIGYPYFVGFRSVC